MSNPKGNRILKKLTNREIRDKHQELGSMDKTAKYFGISSDTVHRAIIGARKCPSRREGNLK